jgi:uncharacterized membrane protein YdbT with pleckstrin-like domain
VDPEPDEEIFFHGHPSWRALFLFYCQALVASLVAGAIVGLITRITHGSVQVPWVVVAVVVVFVAAVVIGQLRRIATVYSITNRRLTIQTGILSREVHQTRLERIQNVNTAQTVFERMLFIGTVDFDTAAEADFSFSFRGVANPREIVRTVDRALHELRGGAPGYETGADV